MEHVKGSVADRPPELKKLVEQQWAIAMHTPDRWQAKTLILSTNVDKKR